MGQLISLIVLFAIPCQATVLTGTFNIPEIYRTYFGACETTTLCMYVPFSTRTWDVSVWFYGTGRNFSQVDVYDAGDIDPTTVTDASVFPYQTEPFIVTIDESSTVFFRGTNGLYGAWVIEDITMKPYPQYANGCTRNPPVLSDYAQLSGTWYVSDTASFAPAPVPEPSAALLFVVGLLFLCIAGQMIRHPR